MDSSSIVSFNNDSTFQSTLKGDYNNVSVHELALHAMRDRCLLLQRRINALESDNMRLKLDITKANENTPYIPLPEDEKFQLQQKIAELNKQKSQLLHHVFMVSCENKNLWNKISAIKGPEKATKEYTKQPLARANTYVHSTPKTSANYQEKYSESSLEEISLKLINSYIQEKSQLVEQYEQMAQLQDADDENFLNVESIGFAYMEDPAMDSLKEIHLHTEKLQNLKKELAQQEQDLKVVITRIETVLKEGYKCPTCIANNTKIITSEHKEIETSDSLANWATPVESSNYNNFSDLNTSAYKKNIDKNDSESRACPNKVCPMCGQNFQEDVAFTEFQSHVENHFIGESEADSVIDNFENVPYSFDPVI
ncbi:protein spindle-F [Ostrinia nubilalis]|uniref:protein spindle-F n=1 Tax=Ostrinia furnacalis TaxID=93504 RepID=UPI0010395AF7|nr:protein spindle-F [Ostrinia furnacalis]